MPSPICDRPGRLSPWVLSFISQQHCHQFLCFISLSTTLHFSPLHLTTHLAQWETIKRFALLPEDFTFDNGGLTFTMKLKRRVVEEKYSALIASLYADVTDPRPTIA